MAENRIIASAVAENELAKAFSDLVAERWDNWNLSPYLAYLVEVCTPAVLPYLAEQFDADGLQGFAVAETDRQRRDLIRRSIALHKYIGTPWAIREACRTVGYPVIILEEGVPAVQGGEPSQEDWARFRVLVEAAEARHVTAEDSRKLRLFVMNYKNARSQLVELGFWQALADTIFRCGPENRDSMQVEALTFIAAPNPVLLTPDGAIRSVSVQANCEWLLSATVYEWPDGSGDKLYIEYTGAAGNTTLSVTADSASGADRELTVEVYHPGGTLLGLIVVRQVHQWRNAYSRAYSNAYCSIPKKLNSYSVAYGRAYSTGTPFVHVPVDAVFLSEAVPDVDIDIVSNTKWKIELK